MWRDQRARVRIREGRPTPAQRRTIRGRMRGLKDVGQKSEDHGRLARNQRGSGRPLGPREETEGRKKGRSERRQRERSRSSRRRKSRQRRQSTSIGSRHAGVNRARRCESGAWQKRHMQRSTLVVLSRRSKQHSVSRERESEACEAKRAAWALSSGSTASRATGVTSEELTVEGTRGEPIGVAILSVARPYTGPNLV